MAYSALYTALQETERRLARTINPTVFTLAEREERRGRGNSFVARIAGRPKLAVIGSVDDLP